jgi:hypothetical protein
LIFIRKWILAQLKPSFETNDDLLRNLDENQRSKDLADNTASKQKGAYDISDDEGSSESENDRQPVELDEAAQARSELFNFFLSLLLTSI